MPQHGATKKLCRGEPILKRKLRHLRSLRQLREHATGDAVRSLLDPPPEAQSRVLKKLKQLWNGVGPILRVQQRIRQRRLMAKIGCLAQQALPAGDRVAKIAAP